MKGEVPIYLGITVDGSPKELSVKRSCDSARWNPHAGRASGTKEDVKTLNTYLNTYQARVFEAKRQLVEGNEMVTASAIKDLLMGVDQRNKMLIKIFEDYNADVKKLIAQAGLGQGHTRCWIQNLPAKPGQELFCSCASIQK